MTLFKTAIKSAIVCFALIPLTALASNYDFSFLTQNIEKTKKIAGIPSGTSIIAVKGDQIVFQAHIGFADIANQIKVTKNTPYYIASVTKPFMALNVLLDMENNRLPSNLQLSTMLPELDVKGLNEQMVGIKQLLSHTSAIDNYPLVLASAYSGLHDEKSLISLANNYSIKEPHDLGTFKYTNVGYNLYSIFADQYFDDNWQTRLRTQLFEPLSMTSTSATRTFYDEQKLKVAKPYSLMVSSLPNALPLEKQDATMHSAGGMYSSASDLAKFLIAQLNQGKVDGVQVFPANVITKSHQQQVTTNANYMDFQRDGYAWGWYTGIYKGENMLHHFGGFSGTHAHLSFMPKSKLGLVVINNEDFLSSKLTAVIADFIYGKLLNENDIENQVAKRFESLNSKLVNIENMLTKQQQKIAERKMNLSLPIGAYQGQYRHPDLGTMVLSISQDNELKVNWGQMNSTVSGFNKLDVIRVTLKPTNGEIIMFEVKERVISLTYQGIKFSRQYKD